MSTIAEIFTLPATDLEAEIRAGDGHAQKILYSGKNPGDWLNNLPAYWAYLTVRLGENRNVTKEDLLRLPIHDLNYLGIRILAFSNNGVVRLRMKCGCGHKFSAEPALSELPERERPAEGQPPDPTFRVTLAETGRQAMIGYLTGEHRRINTGLPTDPVRVAYQAVRSVEGEEALNYETLLGWPERDIDSVIAALYEKRCGYETDMEIQCPSCRTWLETDPLENPGFLFRSVTV